MDARRALALPLALGIWPGRYMTLWLLLAALRMLCLSMAALTSENLRWANCSWVGGAKSREFLGESLLGIGLLMTGGFREGRLTLLERGDLVKGRSGKTSFSLAESWLSLLSRTRCSIVAGFGLTKTWRKTRPWHLSQSNWILHSSYTHWDKNQFLSINSHF